MSIVIKDRFGIKIPYQGRLMHQLCQVGDITWDAITRTWWVPVTRLYDVANIIRPYFPNVSDRLENSPRFQEVRDIILQKQETIKKSFTVKADIDIPHPEGLDYLDYQYGGVSFAYDLWKAKKHGCFIADDMGLGKAQPLTAKVLTPSGYVNMGDVYIGMPITRKDGTAGKVVGIYPKGMKPVYRVTFNNGDFCECCDEHLWQVMSANHRCRKVPGVVKELKELINDLYDKNGNSRWFVPVVDPVQFTKSAPLPIDPYLLGIIISEGGITHSINFSTPEAAILEECRRVLPDGMIIKRIGKYDYRIVQDNNSRTVGGNRILNALRDLGLYGKNSHNKFIPEAYLYASVEDRIRLLQGIMDGDGECTKSTNMTVGYTTVSKQLSEDVRFLIQSLGGVAGKETSRYVHKDGKSFGPYYRYSFRMPTEIRPFMFSTKAEIYAPKGKNAPYRAIANIEYIGDKFCQCIKVDAEDELYVTDNFIVTHNTIQALGFINKISVDLERSPKTLIICPASMKMSWYREAKKWLVRTPSMIVMESGIPAQVIDRHNIVIINYDILKKYERPLVMADWDVTIYDESHYMKNSNAQRSKFGSNMSKVSDFVLLLSGTPLTNRPIDLWHQLNVIDWDMFASRNEFAFRFCGGNILGDGATNLDELQNLLRSTYMIRRMKEDVLTELPPKIRQVVELSRSGFDKALKNEAPYIEAVKAYMDRMDAIEAKKAISGMTEEEYKKEISKMRTGKLGDLGEIARIRHETALAKVGKVVDFVKDILENKQKVVVFAHHRDVIEQITGAFPGESTMLYGGMATADKDAAIQEFMKNPKIRVFVISIIAGGVGLTLTAADVAVFAEMSWLPSDISQAEDRLHRIGQKATTFIYHLVVEGSIDAYMAQKCVSKQIIVDQCVNG